MTGHSPVMLARLHAVKLILESADVWLKGSIDQLRDEDNIMLIHMLEDALYILKRGSSSLSNN